MTFLRVPWLAFVFAASLWIGECKIIRLNETIRGGDREKKYCLDNGFGNVKKTDDDGMCNFMCFPFDAYTGNVNMVYQPNLSPCAHDRGKCLEGQCLDQELVDECFKISAETVILYRFRTPDCVEAICENGHNKELGRLNKPDGTPCHVGLTQGTCKQGECST